MSRYQTIISVEDLEKHLAKEDIKIFDARFNLKDTQDGRRQYLAGHIPGSQYVHLDDDLSGPIIAGVTGRHPLPDREAFRLKLEHYGLSNTDQVVIYDQGHGGLAARMWWMLNWLGHRDVCVLSGGWKAWTMADMPVVKEISKPAVGQFTIRPSHFRTRSSAQVLNLIQRDDEQLVDARASQRYLGLDEPLDPVAGHIPEAINRPFLDNLDADGYWKSAQQLQSEWSELLGAPSSDITIYCGSGVTACHNILALSHAGFAPANLYAGSWSEWITDPNRPIVAKESI